MRSSRWTSRASSFPDAARIVDVRAAVRPRPAVAQLPSREHHRSLVSSRAPWLRLCSAWNPDGRSSSRARSPLSMCRGRGRRGRHLAAARADPAPEVGATRAAQPIEVDGRLEEPAWQAVAPWTRFVQRDATAEADEAGELQTPEPERGFTPVREPSRFRIVRVQLRPAHEPGRRRLYAGARDVPPELLPSAGLNGGWRWRGLAPPGSARGRGPSIDDTAQSLRRARVLAWSTDDRAAGGRPALVVRSSVTERGAAGCGTPRSRVVAAARASALAVAVGAVGDGPGRGLGAASSPTPAVSTSTSLRLNSVLRSATVAAGARRSTLRPRPDPPR